MHRFVENLALIANNLFTAEECKVFLNLAARFPKLSLYNLLLLYYQMPDAKLIAGEMAWKDNYNVNVRQDESAICLVRPKLKEEYTSEENPGLLGYEQIGVFDISQLEYELDIKKEKYSIGDAFYSITHRTVTYDTEGLLEASEDYKIFEDYDDEVILRQYPGVSREEQERRDSKNLIYTYIDEFLEIGDFGPETEALKQCIGYVLCRRYDLDPKDVNNIYLANSNGNGLSFFQTILHYVNEVLDSIENSDSIELTFTEMAYVHVLLKEDSEDEFEAILDYDIEHDDTVLYETRASFVDMLENMPSEAYRRMFEDRENNKVMTQPPYKIKLIDF